MQNSEYDARTDRLGVGSLIAAHGVVSQAAMSVTAQSTPNMTVNVSAGSAVVFRGGATNSSNGAYVVYNDATVILPITAAHATLSRIDLVVLQVYDSAFTGSTDAAQFVVIPGTPASSPTAPLVPDSAVGLARVTVAPAVSAISTPNISVTSRQLARVEPRMTAVLESVATVTSIQNVAVGQLAFETSTGNVKLYTGATLGWQVVKSGALTWSEITGKPSTYPPSAHFHSGTDITSGTIPVSRIPTLTPNTTAQISNSLTSAAGSTNVGIKTGTSGGQPYTVTGVLSWSFRLWGPVVVFYGSISFTVTGAGAASFVSGGGVIIPAPGGNGNIANTKLATMPDVYAPAISSALSSGPAGPLAAFYVDAATGDIIMTATIPTATTTTATSYNVTGTWLR
jgi:hypothetical protein